MIRRADSRVLPNLEIENSTHDDDHRRVVFDSDMETVMEGESGGGDDDGDDSPDADDVCPICFGDFSIPCKTNCGHWFCGSCILQFWNYKASLQKCKCPLCCGPISELIPEACLLSQQEEEVVEVLVNVESYNRLFQGGVCGLLQNVLLLPLLIKRIFQGMMDPDRFIDNYYTVRLIGLLLGLMYQLSPFDFIPTGGFVAYRLFDLCATGVVVILCFIGLCRRAILQRRMRHMAHTWRDL